MELSSSYSKKKKFKLNLGITNHNDLIIVCYFYSSNNRSIHITYFKGNQIWLDEGKLERLKFHILSKIIVKNYYFWKESNWIFDERELEGIKLAL